MFFLLRILISIVLILVVLIGAASASLSWLGSQALDDSPIVTSFYNASLADIKRIKELAVSASTRRIDSEEQSLLLNERDINLGIGYFGPTQIRIPKDTYAKASLRDDNAIITISLPGSLAEENKELILPKDSSNIQTQVFHALAQHLRDKWLNIDLTFSVDDNKSKPEWIQLSQIKIGSLTLTKNLSAYIAEKIYQEFLKQPSANTALETWNNITGLAITNDELSIKFVLPGNEQAIASYQSLVFSGEEQERIQHYYNLLRTLPQRGPLTRVMAPLFTEALKASNTSLNPVAENKAALLALAKLYGGDQLIQMLDTNGDPNALLRAPKPYTLYNRADLAQHYVLSSGLALMANKEIAELIGLDKEIADYAGGRTISAWDLLADKAGARLANKATSSARAARNLQLTLSKVKRDEHLLPDLAREFTFSEDRFQADELNDLNELIELYLQSHTLLKEEP